MSDAVNTPSAPVVNTGAESNDTSTQNRSSEQTSLDNSATTPKLSKKIKLKIDGQEVEESLPFEYDESNQDQVNYLKRQIQLAKVAQKRMNEASVTRKQAEQFIQALHQNPLQVLSDERIMGHKKFREIAEQFLLGQIEAESLSPEQKRQKEMEERLKRYEEQEQESKKKVEEQRMAQLEAHYAQQYEKTIIDALNVSSLPKNNFTVKRMAELLQKNLQYGLELDPTQLAQIVRQDYQKELVSLIGGSDADQILSMFGEDVANKIRKHDLAKIKGAQFQPKDTKLSSSTPKADSASRPMTMSEWREKNGRG